MSSKLRSIAFPLVAGAILVVTGVVSGVTVAAQTQTLEAQQSTLQGLTAKVEAARTATSDMESAISLEDSGAQAARVANDTSAIGDLMRRALTWDSDESYREARASTMRVYSLADDSSFMTSFLPEAPVTKDSQGNEYSYIDAADLNSRVGDVTVKLLSVDAVNYEYMALVDAQAASSDGLGTAVNVATVFVTIDGDGALSNISGFASTSRPLTSG